MSPQRDSLPEALVAIITTVRKFSGMLPLVGLESVWRGEALLTIIANVIASVEVDQVHVFLQSFGLEKGLLAKFTLVRFEP